jgi:serine/threonine-protein kinase ULK/ATG1
MSTALEIGSSAEQYMSEGQYQKALDKFQLCLGILIPLLSNEPKGHRRDLLYSQIQRWMKQAESTKALLCVLDLEDASIPENKGKCSCVHVDKTEMCLSVLKHKMMFCYVSCHISVLYSCAK